MNILLPTDFSVNSRNAINYALQLFKNEKCTFYFLHAFPRAIYSYEKQLEMGVFGGDLVKEETERKSALLKRFVASFKDDFTVNQKVYTLISRDFATEAIKETVKEKEIDLIVLGAKGETSSRNVVFGSATSYVLTKVKVPTITIPSGYKFEAIKNILFPSDYLVKHNSKVVESLKNIVAISKAKVTIAHCSVKELTSTQEQNSANLQTLLNGENPLIELIKKEDFIEAIEEKMENFDMLFMVNNKKSFFENLFFTPTVSKVVVSLKKPFLVSHF